MSRLFPSGVSPASKVSISAGQLPGYVAASQFPIKQPPWRTLHQLACTDCVTVVIPDGLYQAIWESVEATITRPKYAKVIMKLEDVLKGDFFTEYIKKGNVLMLSEGEPGIDDVYSLKEGTRSRWRPSQTTGAEFEACQDRILMGAGILRLDLSKESYERAGLQVVEINLRLASMLHGKQGFDRLVRAAKQVLNQSLNWLFLDLNSSDADLEPHTTGPLSEHRPTIHLLAVSARELTNTVTPRALTNFPDQSSSVFSSEETQETMYEILEYLGMLALVSPRVQATDHIDPYLSRYTVPGFSECPSSDDAITAGQTVRILTWTGVISCRWLLTLLCAIIKNSRITNLQTLDVQQQWLAISISSHRTQAIHELDGCTILLQPGRDVQTPQDPHETPVLATNVGAINIENDEQERDTSSQGQDEDLTLAKTRPPRAGFQRFLCAEWTDNLT